MVMRPIFLALAVFAASASPAPAQTTYDPGAVQLDIMVQQQIDRQRQVALENQLNSLEARVQNEERLRGLETMRGGRPNFTPPDANAPPIVADKGGYATIPDSALAASNARVRAASQIKR
jgi:hypothetical protein